MVMLHPRPHSNTKQYGWYSIKFKICKIYTYIFDMVFRGLYNYFLQKPVNDLKRNVQIMGKEREMIVPVFIQMIEDPGDQDWMTDLYTKYYKLMISTASFYLDDRQDVEEIVNDSLLALYEKIDRIRSLEPRALTTYIITTVRNTAFTHLRRQKMINKHFLYLSDHGKENISSADDVERLIEARDQLEIVRRIINALPENEQAVIRLRFEMGLDCKEIAEILDVSPDAVRQSIVRARNRIQKALHREEVRA